MRYFRKKTDDDLIPNILKVIFYSTYENCNNRIIEWIFGIFEVSSRRAKSIFYSILLKFIVDGNNIEMVLENLSEFLIDSIENGLFVEKMNSLLVLSIIIIEIEDVSIISHILEEFKFGDFVCEALSSEAFPIIFLEILLKAFIELIKYDVNMLFEEKIDIEEINKAFEMFQSYRYKSNVHFDDEILYSILRLNECDIDDLILSVMNELINSDIEI